MDESIIVAHKLKEEISKYAIFQNEKEEYRVGINKNSDENYIQRISIGIGMAENNPEINSIKSLRQNSDIALLEVKSSSNIGYINEERKVIVY